MPLNCKIIKLKKKTIESNYINKWEIDDDDDDDTVEKFEIK